MAQGLLTGTAGTAAVGAAVLLGGAAVEVAGATAAAPTILDGVVGAGFAAAALRRSAARGRRRDRAEQCLALATALAWFLATAATLAPRPLREVAGVTVLAYRGPLLHWLLVRVRAARSRRVLPALAAVGYLAAVGGTTSTALSTAAVAACDGCFVVAGSWRRRADTQTAILLLLVAVLWAVLGVGILSGLEAAAASASVLLLVAWRASIPAEDAELGPAIGSLVVELGPTSRPGSPVTASLARALADPDLAVRTYQSGVGWADELGRPVEDPTLRQPGGEAALTEVAMDGGRRVVLVHGSRDAAGSRLARAAATAAGLVLDRVHVQAQVRHEATEVRRSTARLLTVNEAERSDLAARLAAGPIARLRRVQEAFTRRPGTDGEALTRELSSVISELEALSAGLNPAAVRQGRLADALDELARSTGVPTTVTVSGDVATLGEDLAALAYFVAAECLVNVRRHARATTVDLTVSVTTSRLRLEVTDDGQGGAALTAGGGLQGLADRISVASGTLRMTSPTGGPTIVAVDVPRGPAPATA